MRLRSTLILLALVIVTAVVASLLSGRPVSHKQVAGRSAVLPGFRADAVQSVTIEHAGERTVCRREGEEWRLVEPVETRADADRIDRMLNAFQTARTAATFALPDGGAVSQYGLKTPRCSVTLATQERSWIVHFGAPMPVGNMTYAAVEGRQDALAVRSDLVASADLTAADLRSKLLAPGVDPAALQALAITAAPLGDSPGFALACHRTDKGWQLTSPVEDLADADAVKQIAIGIRDFRAAREDLVTGSPSSYGLDKPDLTVTLTVPAGAQTLLFSQRPDGCYAMLKGEAAPVRVPADLFTTLSRPPADLRDHALTHMAPSDVARIELAGPKGQLALARQPAGWQIAGPAPVSADEAMVAGLLDALVTARADSFSAEAPAGLVRATAALRDVDGAALAELHFGLNPATGDLFAMRPDYHAVLLLRKDERLDALFAGRLALLNRTLLQAPEAEAAQIDLQDAAGGSRVVWDAGWRLTAPTSGPADEEALNAILGDFADLRVEGFAAEHGADPAAFGLDKPRATATVFYRPAGGGALVSHTLRIGAAADGAGAYAALDGDERVFILPDAMVGHYTGRLASKAICSADNLVGLTFRAGARSAKFSYDMVRDAWTDASGAPLPDAAASALQDAIALLGDFRARAVADYVEKSPALYGFDPPYLQIDLAERTTSGKRILIGKEAPGGGHYIMGPVTGFVLIAKDADVARLRAVLGQQPLPSGG